MARTYGWLLFLVLLGIMNILACAQQTLTVPDDYPTIQAAIDACVDGDKVVISDGVYTGDGNRDLSLGGKAITIHSENGPGNCIIDCQGSYSYSHRGFSFGSSEGADSVVSGLTITNGYALHGGGIYCSSGPDREYLTLPCHSTPSRVPLTLISPVPSV